MASRIEWVTPVGTLLAVEPTPAEILAHCGVLATAYNDPHNALMLGHDAVITPREVITLYAEMAERGDVPFLLFRDGELAGDADVRGMAQRTAELAILVAMPSAQGKGLGTRFAIMVHAFAFAQLPVDQLYASIRADNTASRRVFEKLGYVLDRSSAASAYADEPGDVVMSIDRATFLSCHAADMAQIVIAVR